MRCLDALCKREQLYRQCDGPACMMVATPIAWPDSRLEQATGPFIMGALFKVSFPKGATTFLVLADGDPIAKYGSDRWIGVQVLIAAKAKRPQWDGSRNTRPDALTCADIPRIQHTNTPDDAEPANLEDRRVWRYALSQKGDLFESATQMTVAQRGALTVHLSDARAAGDTTAAYVVHRRLNDSDLFVQAKGFSLDDVRSVIGSIEAQRE